MTFWEDYGRHLDEQWERAGRTKMTEEQAIERIETAIALVGPYGSDRSRAAQAWNEMKAIALENPGWPIPVKKVPRVPFKIET